MFYEVELSDVGYVKPSDLGKDLREILADQFRRKYVGRFVKEAGLILEVLEITDLSYGASVVGSPNIYVRAKFRALSYMPLKDEVIEGEIENVVDYGIFVTAGPINGFVHISQLGDDVFVHRGGVIQGRKLKVTLRPGDVVRARVTAVSKPDPSAPLRNEPIIKVALTMRQPKLGKLEVAE